jgi:voltage-gated potassium channel
MIRWIRMAVVLVLTVGAYFLVPVTFDNGLGAVGRAVGALAVFAALIALMVVQLRSHLDNTARRVDGLVVTIILSVEVFALTFYLIATNQPGQFDGLQTRLDALYFAVTTLATVGYGDIHAVGQPARALVLVEMTFNVVFVAAAAALLSAHIRSAAGRRVQERQQKKLD